MKIYSDLPLSQFEFWSGGRDRAELLTAEELDRIGEELEAMDFWADGLPEGVQVNDLFWFDFDTVCELIGLNPEEVYKREEARQAKPLA